ncbi:hypothetical protein ZIOFF_035677 [Zingiber officinale]|uniref:Myb/SANT-like domain-containing protein n=1 Tax=Zingiber officinale TaxID=94328 RepID=A0A8J5L799_ZINOF|nr:hypothetical protein ZIOFF_035677 [Zingiber officinale]
MGTPIEQVKRDVLKWTEEMDRIFIDAILEQQVNGNRIGDTFTSTAYKDMVVICNEKIEIPLTKDNLKNRIKTLKSHFNSCYDLFKNASGVQWHAKSRRFEANPSIKKWRYTLAAHYEKLLELFGHDRANGQRASTVIERNVEIILEEEQRDLGLDDEHENFEVIPDSPPFDDRSRKRKLASIDSYALRKIQPSTLMSRKLLPQLIVQLHKVFSRDNREFLDLGLIVIHPRFGFCDFAQDKKSLQLGPEDNLYVEGFASNLFAKADKQDRAGRADLLTMVGKLIWKAADIRKALKEGQKPEPSPPGGDPDQSISSGLSSYTYGTQPSDGLPSSQQFDNALPQHIHKVNLNV